jgi:hypothetical protein
MAKKNYQPLDWAEGSPVAGERYATNGHYTGHYKGTPTQDALADTDANINGHQRENATPHIGTITQDAAGEMPELETDGEEEPGTGDGGSGG